MRSTGLGTLSALAALPDGIDASVERVGGFEGDVDTAGASLTDRQREALAAGIAVGYYEVPRAGGVNDVAAERAVSKSTAAAHLRKAAAALVEAFLD